MLSCTTSGASRKRAVITGAASGLGRDISIVLGRKGFEVLLADIDEKEAAFTLKMFEQAGGSGHIRRCDVTKAEPVQTPCPCDGAARTDLNRRIPCHS